jgi:TolA-binding protein
MNLRTKFFLRVLLVLLLAAGITNAVFNQKAISQAKQENQRLVNDATESQRLETENKQLSQTGHQPEDIKELKQENTELPKLRNEVRQLRRQTEELEYLRGENKRLLMEQKGDGKPAIATTHEKFIPKAALIDAGLATPEATLQTMVWAQSQGNIKRLFECSTRGAELMPQGEEAKLMGQKLLSGMKMFPGFRIAEKKVVSDNEIIMGFQMSTTGSIMRIPLKRVGTEWRLDQ